MFSPLTQTDRAFFQVVLEYRVWWCSAHYSAFFPPHRVWSINVGPPKVGFVARINSSARIERRTNGGGVFSSYLFRFRVNLLCKFASPEIPECAVRGTFFFLPCFSTPNRINLGKTTRRRITMETARRNIAKKLKRNDVFVIARKPHMVFEFNVA